MRNTRLAGHELRHEGRIYGGYGVGYVNGPGKTMCTCGARSPELPSTTARKRWHTEHKQALRNTETKPSGGAS
jgi:hypothetical protein